MQANPQTIVSVLSLVAVVASAQPGTGMPPPDPRVTLRLDAVEVIPSSGPAVPRYRFEPGTRLQYIARGERTGRGEPEYTLLNVGVYPLRQNPDGTWRLVLVQRQVEQSIDSATGTLTATASRGSLAWCDLAPDGRFEECYGVSSDEVAALFAPLPRDSAEAAVGWRTADASGFESRSYRVAGFERGTGQLVIRSIAEGLLNKVYEVALDGVVLFDTAAGRLVARETHSKAGWPQPGEQKGSVELTGVTVLPQLEAERFAAEAETLWRAWILWDTLTDEANANPDREDSLHALADSALVRGRRIVTRPELRDAADGDIEDFREYLAMLAERPDEAKQPVRPAPESLVGRAAPGWELPSLDGRTYSLAGLRGKVVVLDFWYRGCPWCIRAMPALKALAEEFAGRPVQIVGMNVDRDSSDARFVVEKLGLNYPNLLATDVPKAYLVRGYPTLFVVDRQGKIAHAKVGYSSTLREDLAEIINGLLEAK